MCSTQTRTAWWRYRAWNWLTPDALAQLSQKPELETVVLVPRELLLEYARKVQDGDGVNFDDFDSHFDRFAMDVVRLENLQHYAISDEDARVKAFREGTTRPERSVRTEPWLARIAITTVAGKNWERVHVVDQPLSGYLRYELVGYVESQAAGELIADRAADESLTQLGEDFWLFDGDSPNAYAVLMHYDGAGHFVGFEHTTEPAMLDRCRRERELVLRRAVDLNTYLADRKADL